MSKNVQSAMLEILNRTKADVSDVKSDVSVLKSDVSDIKVRIDRVEIAVSRQSRDSAAMLVMMRGTVGVFNERMHDLEEEVGLIVERGS